LSDRSRCLYNTSIRMHTLSVKPCHAKNHENRLPNTRASPPIFLILIPTKGLTFAPSLYMSTSYSCHPTGGTRCQGVSARIPCPKNRTHMSCVRAPRFGAISRRPTTVTRIFEYGSNCFSCGIYQTCYALSSTARAARRPAAPGRWAVTRGGASVAQNGPFPAISSQGCALISSLLNWCGLQGDRHTWTGTQ
jgi:hypothetical protein